MLAILLAAHLAAAADAGPPVAIAAASPLTQIIRTRPPKACSGATRIDAALPPAAPTLFRQQDRRAALPRKLGDLPPAEPCLAGARMEARK